MVLNIQLQHLANDQQTALGGALAEQLSETLKQPLIDNDIISIQVILDNLISETPQVGRAIAYNHEKQLLAQSQGHNIGHLNLYQHTRPIIVDSEMTGQIRIELRQEVILKKYQQLLWLTLATWLLPTLLLGYKLHKNVASITRRIAHINASLPLSVEPITAKDELTTLEQQIAPLLTETQSAHREQHQDHCLLAVCLSNTPRLKAQLNSEHFDQILETIDNHIEHSTVLFGGNRLRTHNNTVLLKFSHIDVEHRLLQAISCASAILTVCKQLALSEGTPLELKCALGDGSQQQYSSQWRNALAVEESTNPLTELLSLATPGEILLENTVTLEGNIGFCETSSLPSSNARQFLLFHQDQQIIFNKQLVFLHSLSTKTQ